MARFVSSALAQDSQSLKLVWRVVVGDNATRVSLSRWVKKHFFTGGREQERGGKNSPSLKKCVPRLASPRFSFDARGLQNIRERADVVPNNEWRLPQFLFSSEFLLPLFVSARPIREDPPPPLSCRPLGGSGDRCRRMRF